MFIPNVISGTHWVFEIINLLIHDAVTDPMKAKDDRFVEVDGIEKLDALQSPRIINSHLPRKFVPDHILQNVGSRCTSYNCSLSQ